MKIFISVILCIVILICSFSFGYSIGFHNEEAVEKDRLITTCEDSLQQSIEMFEKWNEQKDNMWYWYGVDYFGDFLNAMSAIRAYHDDSLSPYFALCDNVSYILHTKSDECQKKMIEIINALTVLCKDINNPNAYDDLNAIYMEIIE